MDIYNLVRKGEEIATYIAMELHKVGAPVTLLYGSALHEYRNGTGNCVHPYFHEDDFDIGVFKEHFHYVVSLIDEIEERFSWKVDYIKQDLILSFAPPGQGPKTEESKGFQIDVYSFEADPRNGLVSFRWDKVRVASDAFFPLLKHKQVFASETHDSTIPFFYMPFNLPCYLANMYGEDYMTPKKGFKLGNNCLEGVHRGDRFNHPHCNTSLSVSQQCEFDRQMSFANKSYEGQSVADEIFHTRYAGIKKLKIKQTKKAARLPSC